MFYEMLTEIPSSNTGILLGDRLQYKRILNLLQQFRYLKICKQVCISVQASM